MDCNHANSDGKSPKCRTCVPDVEKVPGGGLLADQKNKPCSCSGRSFGEGREMQEIHPALGKG